MKEGLESSTLLEVETDKVDSIPDRGDEAGTSNGDVEGKKSPLISADSVSVNDSAVASPGRKIEEKGSEPEVVECRKNADAALNVDGDVNAASDDSANVDAETDQGKLGLGRGQWGRTKKMEGSEKHYDNIGQDDEEKRGSSLIPAASVSVEDSAVSLRERKVEEKGSETEHVECGKDADAFLNLDGDANAGGDNSANIGAVTDQVKRGRKRKMEGSKKRGDTTGHGDEEKREPPLISADSVSTKDSVVSLPRKVEEKGSEPEHVECGKDADATPNLDRDVNAGGDDSANVDAESDQGKCGLQRGCCGRKRKIEGSKKRDDIIGEGGEEKSRSPLILADSVSVKGSAVSSSERTVQEKRRGVVERGKDADDALNVDGDVNVRGDYSANVDAGTDQGKPRLGRGQRRRKRKTEVSKQHNDPNGQGDEDKIGSSLISADSISVKDSGVSLPQRNLEEKGSEPELAECDKDADATLNADRHVYGDGDGGAIVNAEAGQGKCRLGRCWQGRKRKMQGSKKRDDTTGQGDEEKRGSPLISNESGSLKVSALSSPERKTEKERSGSERVECITDADAGDVVGANANCDRHTLKFGKGRRGRKRKIVESSECSEDDIAGRKKAKEESLDGKTQVVGRVLRSRTIGMSGGEKAVGVKQIGGVVVGKRKKYIAQSDKGKVETEKDENTLSIGKPKTRFKGRRGRPPKVQGKSGASDVVYDGTEKLTGSNKTNNQSKAEDIIRESKFPKVKSKNVELIGDKKKRVTRFKRNSDQSNAEYIIKGSRFAVDAKHNKPTTLSRPAVGNIIKKRLKIRKHHKGGEVGLKRRKEQQLVREQIIGMLKKAGWTIEYRPRMTKEYKDAVYVSPEGRTHWSVTLAYRMFKEKIEAGEADSYTISAFTPIQDEVLSKLFRVRKKKKEREMKLKQLKEHGGKNNEGVATKKSEKNKHRKKSIGCSKSKGKPTSDLSLSGKSSNTRSNGKLLQCEKAIGISRRRMPRSTQEERQSRKQFALLVRSLEKSSDTDCDDLMPYNGKRSLISWMIDLGTVLPGGKVQYMNRRRTSLMLEGKITSDGIHCACCDEIITILEFQSHAGGRLSEPFRNIYLESGISLLQCLHDSWSKQEESKHIGFHFVDVDGDDPNDDTCNICGDGGDLICCDGCPSTFHQSCLDIQKFPSGDWHCVYCSCKFCGTVGVIPCQRDDNQDTLVYNLLKCRLCEEKFHQLCMQGEGAINFDLNSPSFCGRRCQELFEQLQVLLGVKHELEEGFSWTLLQRCDVNQDISLSDAPSKLERNSKLAVALSIMDECFLPIVDQRSGINMIHNVVYSCGSNFSRLDYSGFFTVILERGDEIISAASIRIHGNQLAEMPFIGTRNMYRRQGMCRRLLNAIEMALCTLNVQKLVIPAISELLQAWTSVFGFKPLERSKRQEMRYTSMIVFPGTDMLQKPILRHQFSEGNLMSTAVLKSTELRTKLDALHEGTSNSNVGCSPGADSNASPEVIVQHAGGVDVEAAAVESGSHHSDVSYHSVSDTTSGMVCAQESANNEKCLAQLEMTYDNKPAMDSEGSASDAPDLGQQTAEEINTRPNAQCHSITAPVPHMTLEFISKFNQQGIYGIESKSSTFSRVGSDVTNCEGEIPYALENGKGAADHEQNGEAKFFRSDCNSLDEGSICHSADILAQPLDTDAVQGFRVFGKKFVCQESETTSLMSSEPKHELQLRHNLIGVVSDTTSASHNKTQDAANDSYRPFPDDTKPNFFFQSDVLDTHDLKAIASIDDKSLPLSGISCDTTAGPNSQMTCVSNGHCKSLECQSGIDNNDICGIKKSTFTCSVGARHETSVVTGNDIHDLKQEFTAVQTDCHSLNGYSLSNVAQISSFHQSESGSLVNHTDVTLCDSEPFCNSNSCPGVTGLCASGSCNACGMPKVGSCRLLRSGNLC